MILISADDLPCPMCQLPRATLTAARGYRSIMPCHSPQLAPLPTNIAITSAGLVTCSSKLPWERYLTHWGQEQHQPHISPHPGAPHPAPRTASCCPTTVPHIPVPGTCWVCAGELSSSSLPHPYSAKFDTSSKGCTANLPAVLLQTCVNCCTVPRASFTGGGMQINCLFLALMVPHSWCRPTPSSNCFQTCSLSQSALGESPPPGKGFLEQQLCFSH